MSKPVKIIADDGHTYILKRQQVYNPQTKKYDDWNCMFLQEALVYNIARYLNITVPECAAVYVDSEHLNAEPSLVFNRYRTGNHFGSREIENVEDNLKNGYQMLLAMGKPYVITSWKNFFGKISNKNEIPRIIVLDLLTCNFDRFGNHGNLMISRTPDGNRQVVAIDHGHAFFGPMWITEKRKMLLANKNTKQFANWQVNLLLQNNGGKALSGLGEIFRAIEQHIDLNDPNDHCFIDVVYQLENLDRADILKWFNGIPDEWYINKDQQITEYTDFLMRQKGLLRDILNILVKEGAFSNSIIGGELNWKEKRTGTQ